MSRIAGRALLAVVLAAAAASCGVLSPVNVEIRRQMLAEAPQVEASETLPVTLLVLSPQASPAYDTTRMAYTEQPYHIAYFAKNEWAESPSAMLQTLLVRTLDRTHRFSAVVTPPYFGKSAYALRADLVELRQDFTSDRPLLRLAVRVQLVDQANDAVVATRELAEREPMREKSPEAGVVAANDAAARLLREVARFVVSETR